MGLFLMLFLTFTWRMFIEISQQSASSRFIFLLRTLLQRTLFKQQSWTESFGSGQKLQLSISFLNFVLICLDYIASMGLLSGTDLVIGIQVVISVHDVKQSNIRGTAPAVLIRYHSKLPYLRGNFEYRFLRAVTLQYVSFENKFLLHSKELSKTYRPHLSHFS